VAYLYLSGYVGDSVRWYIDTTGSWALVTAGSFPNSLTYETPPLSRTARFRARVYQGRCYVETDIILISVDTFRVQSITLSPRTGTGTCVGDTVRFDTTVSRRSGNLDIDSLVLIVRTPAGDTVYYPDRLWFVPTLAGTYQVWVMVYGGRCAGVMSNVQSWAIGGRPPVYAIQGPDTVYVGGSMAGGYGYRVSVGADFHHWYGRQGSGGSTAPVFNPSNATSTSVTFARPSSGCRPDTLWAVYQTANGCRDSSRKVVAVCPCGAAGTVSASSSRVCQGEVAYLYLSGYVGDSVRWYIDTTGSWALVTAGSFPNSLTYETPPLSRTARFRARVYQGRCYVETDIILISVDTFRVQSITLSPRTGTGTCVGDTVRFDTTVSRRSGNLDIDSLVLIVRTPAGDTVYYPDRLWFVPTLAGTYQVWVMVYGGRCAGVMSNVQSWAIGGRPPVYAIQGPDTVYVGGSMAGGYGYSVSVGADFHHWYGRQGSGGSTAPVFSPSNATSTSVTFGEPFSGCRPDTLWAVYQTANGCRDSSRKVVAVCPCGAAGTVSASSSRVCQGEVAYLYLSGYVGDSVRWYIDTTGSWALVTAGSFPNSLTYETPPLSRTARFRARVYQGRCYVETGIILISVDTFRVQSITLSPRTGTGTCVGDTVRFDTTVSRRSGNLDIDSLVLIVRTPAGDTVYYPDRLWFVPTLAGTYQVWVMVYGGRCAGVMSNVQSWAIGGRPPVYAIQGPDTVYVPPSGASYSYTLPGSFTSLSWSYRPGGGSASTLSGNPTVNVSFTAPPSTGRVDTLIATYEVVGASCPQVSTPKLIAVMPCRSVPSARALTPVVCVGQRGAVEIPLPFPVDSLRWQYWDWEGPGETCLII
jgi:hypothetical protein